jgi:hypothetical protein
MQEMVVTAKQASCAVFMRRRRFGGESVGIAMESNQDWDESASERI